jgi:hypothetical protein
MPTIMCRECCTGTLRGDMVPSGWEQMIHGLPTYIVDPPSGIEPLGTVVILSDAFGWKLPNTRALTDTYARRVPCRVYVPDVMNGTCYLPDAHGILGLQMFANGLHGPA